MSQVEKDLVATPDPSISILSLVIFLISNVYNNERQFHLYCMFSKFHRYIVQSKIIYIQINNNMTLN